MRRACWVLALTGPVGVILAAEGCSSNESKDGDLALPGRDPTKDSGATESGSSGNTDSGTEPAPDCKSLALKVSDRPACDTCTKEKCCAEVLTCDKSADCKALQECLEPCAQDDDLCILTCIASHEGGSDKLQDVGQCAASKCKNECPPPDAGGDPFDAG